MKHPVWLAVALIVGMAGWQRAPAQEKPVEFNRDIRPILSDNCYQCHGPDAAHREADLRLDTRAGAFAEVPSGGKAFVPGQPEASAAFERITSDDEFVRMPPPDSGKQLSPEEIDQIRQWIASGAEWQDHWAFVQPARPAPPDVPSTEGFVRNPIDRFLLARFAQEGIQPAPPADKETLIRRVTLDLTGLPPTLAEVDAFLDDSSPDAYEKVVDRLLASPHYGEEMARQWLDAARYGDTHGLHLDNERSIWPYRDWVIRAFNENEPFDRFTVDQLAGDLLPEPTRDQRVATGFNRCNVTTSEGGAIDAEFLVRYAVDRTETTGTVWLGLTVGCAVCHDHKFDPISHKEFYQLYSFFYSMSDPAMDGNALLTPPVMALPSPEQEARQAALDGELAQVKQSLADALAKVEYTDPQSDASLPAEPTEFVWIDDELPAGAEPAGDGSGWQFVEGPDHPVLSGKKAHLGEGSGRTQHFFTGAKPGLRIGEGDRLFTYVYLDPANPPREIMLQFNDGNWEHRAAWGADLIDWGKPGTPSRLAVGPLPQPGQWVRLEVEAAKLGLAPGATVNGWAFTQFDGRVYWDQAGLVTRTPQQGQTFDSLAAWDAYQRSVGGAGLPQPVQAAVKVEPEKRTDEQKKIVRDHFLQNVCTATRPTFAPLQQRLAEVERQLEGLKKEIPSTLVSQELAQPRQAHLLHRGEYDQPREPVERAIPAVLGRLPEDAPRNRLGLARWLVGPDNPLTARVTVNRFWQHYFGVGIVKTAEDFGVQGERPVHPELLDWLATEFVASGWNVKHVQRLIVTSGAYRQSARTTPEAVERDPENRLLARGPRFRLEAEAVRDSALFVSGLLVDRIGGPSVKPYQPSGLWKAISYPTSTTAQFVQDHGEALYRRSLYTFWKRTSPPPTMLLLDAPSRETCTVRRARTNTPLAALALMNDVQFFEAARKLAERVIREGGPALDDRLTLAFRLATARRPAPGELAVLREQYEAHLAAFRADPDAAARAISAGESPRDPSLDPAELAAWTMVANLILNLDEVITKG